MAMLDAVPQPSQSDRIAALEAQVATLLQFAKAVIAKTEGTDACLKVVAQSAEMKKGVGLMLTMGEKLRDQFPSI